MSEKKLNNFVYDTRNVASIKELAETSAELFGEHTAFMFHSGDGIGQITYAESDDMTRSLSTYFNSLGLENKKIAVIGRNSYKWAITYLSVLCGTGIIVPLDRDLNREQINWLLSDSGASAVVYSEEQAEKFSEKKDGVIYLPMSDFDLYTEKGKALRLSGDRSYEEHIVNPYVLGILIYTSGTMGVAKGVMLSQYNIASNIVAVQRRCHISPEDRALSVLPLHHTYESMSGFLSMYYAGAQIAYNDSLRSLQQDFVLFKPTLFVAVPLLLEKLYGIIIKKYSKLKGGKTVLSIQTAFSHMTKSDSAKKRLFGSVTEAFGGRLRCIICGAASISPETYKGYNSFGIKVYIGYGLTETSPVCAMHSDFYQSPDDIGFPLVGVSMKIDDPNADGVGELVVKGSNVMLGYYNNPTETARVLRDGWFYTGDLAKKLDNGAYKIMGRLKSMIVAQNGKKIFPEELEYYIEKSSLVSESFVFEKSGDDGEHMICASVYPDREAIRSVIEKNGGQYSDEAVEDEIKKLIKSINTRFPSYKAIRKIIVRKEEFIKTTTHKIKRNDEGNKTED